MTNLIKINFLFLALIFLSAPLIAEDNINCGGNAVCFGQKYMARATVFCSKQVERIAKYDFKWTDSWYQAKYDRIAWKDKEKGWLIYAGDKIKFQNGFGAWGNFKYFCHYDPHRDLVLDIQVEAGRFGD